MRWDEIVEHTASRYGHHLAIGEASSWVTLVLSAVGLFRGMHAIFASITPDVINPWLIMIGSSVTGAVAIGTLAYTRIVRARLDGETLEAIFKANQRAIEADKPVPWPAFLPRGAIKVTTTVDIKTPPESPK